MRGNGAHFCEPEGEIDPRKRHPASYLRKTFDVDRLDSHISMTKAHEIYLAAGFHRVNTPGDFPEAFRPVAVFMEMAIE